MLVRLILAASVLGATLTTGAIAADRVSRKAIPSPDVVAVPEWNHFYTRPTVYEPIASAATRASVMRIAYLRSRQSTGSQSQAFATSSQKVCASSWDMASLR